MDKVRVSFQHYQGCNKPHSDLQVVAPLGGGGTRKDENVRKEGITRVTTLEVGPGWLRGCIGSDSLRAGLSDTRIPMGARFSSPVQTDPGAHSASCTMGTGSLSWG
jgi:hypothetical protein